MKHPAVHICLALLAILSAPSLVAAECLQGDCRNGKGVLVHKDGRRYQGEFKNGLISGAGSLVLPDGAPKNLALLSIPCGFLDEPARVAYTLSAQ